jgi:hypothetical protein
MYRAAVEDLVDRKVAQDSLVETTTKHLLYHITNIITTVQHAIQEWR